MGHAQPRDVQARPGHPGDELLGGAGVPVGVVPAPVRAAAVAGRRMPPLGIFGNLARQPVPPGIHERPGAKPRGPGRPRVMEERQTLLALAGLRRL
jgi:hypothetical protein